MTSYEDYKSQALDRVKKSQLDSLRRALNSYTSGGSDRYGLPALNRQPVPVPSVQYPSKAGEFGQRLGSSFSTGASAGMDSLGQSLGTLNSLASAPYSGPGDFLSRIFQGGSTAALAIPRAALKTVGGEIRGAMNPVRSYFQP